MARLGSQALAGFYPTPEDQLPQIAALITWSEDRWRTFQLLDPCAGEGVAIRTLRTAWFGEGGEKKARIHAVEMEATRFTRLESGLEYSDRKHHADAFTVRWGEGEHVHALFLNPPYDHDPDFGRLEHRFLERFTPAIADGGALIFVVPFHALAASAEFLAKNFRDLRCYRFPEPHFAAFKQVVVVGRRQRCSLFDTAVADRIRGWAAAATIPTLGSESAVIEIPQGVGCGLDLEVLPFDPETCLQHYRPGAALPLGLDLDVQDLLGRRYPVALPPKPAHVAMALMAGVFNGHAISPDPAHAHLPDLLIKGVTRRIRVEVQRKTDAEGEQVASVQVEQPSLDVSALVLSDPPRYLRLSRELEISGSDQPESWGVGDVLHRYQRSLAELMDRQFPAVHDPRDPAQQFPMPPVTRPPFAAQADTVRAALKLISEGLHPMIQQETGTGKSQVALTVRAALSPEHHARAAAELRRQGFEGRLPVVRRTLIACPPHLLDGWCDEVAAVSPEARVVVVDSISDLHREGEIYLVTRERLKLGHAFRGIEGSCPGCGAAIAEDAETIARKRLRCSAETLEPADDWAEMAQTLALALFPTLPQGCDVPALSQYRALQRRTSAPRPFTDLERPRQVAGRLVRKLIAGMANEGSMPSTLPANVRDALIPLAQALGRTQLLARYFRRLIRQRKAARRSYYSWDEVANTLEEGCSQLDNLQPRTPAEAVHAAYDHLAAKGTWRQRQGCGEPLFQASGPARYPLARYIARYCRDRFDLVVLDEVHEASNKGTAQQKSLHRLVQLGAPVLAMSGTMMGGYPSSLFANLQALSPAFRQDYGRDQLRDFVRRFGLEVVEVRAKKGVDEAIDFGSRSDRERLCNTRRLREAPDILPEAILRYVLRQGVIMHLSDLEEALPPKTEHVALIEPATGTDRELLAEYRRVLAETRQRMSADRFVAGRAGKLGGALAQLGSYLDRAALGPFQVTYPDGEHVATGKAFDPAIVTAKERWLLETVRTEIAEGRRCLVFVRHSRVGLAQRLERLIAEHVTSKVAFLDSQKVTSRKRQAWIDREVHKKRVQVMIVNPVAVATGLNNLAKCRVPGLPGFSTAIWYQLCFDARVCRQAADGRLRRIGQTQEVRIHYAAWAGTTQEIGLDLITCKIEASRRVDGLTVRDALAGANGDEEGAVAALAIGEAMMRRLEVA